MKIKLYYSLLLILFIPGLMFTKSNNKRIYISQFNYLSDNEAFDYYKSSLPNSLRSTINREMSIDMQEDELDADELREKGYDYYIKGSYKITKKETFVTFSLIHVKYDRAVLIAFAHGAKGGTAIFDMIDGISKLVVKLLKMQDSRILSRTRILSVDKQGNIKQSTESLAGLDLSGGNFSGADLSGRDLRNSNFEGANLTRVIFTGADLRGANFKNANLNRAVFSQSNINNANFEGAKNISVFNNFSSTKNQGNAKFDPYAKNIISTPATYIGFYLGPGYSYNQHQEMSGGVVMTRLVGSFAARLIFKTGYYFGVFADLGYTSLRSLEFDPDNSSYEVGYDMHYFFFSFGPAIIYKSFVFYSGLTLNILLKGTNFKANSKDSDRELFNEFNIGFVLGFRFKYYSHSNFDLTAGVDMRFQIDDLSNKLPVDQKIFALYLSLGMLFSI